MSAAKRLLALLAGHPEFDEGHHKWRFSDLALWIPWLRRNGVLLPGAVEIILANAPRQEVSDESLEVVLQPEALAKLLASLAESPRELLTWWRDGLTPEFRKRSQFPLEVVTIHSPQVLRQQPKVVVGTIHSVKGGQADVVYLFPDLSKASDAQYRLGGPHRDSVIRMFYVGVTRARETLYICSPAGSTAGSI